MKILLCLMGVHQKQYAHALDVTDRDSLLVWKCLRCGAVGTKMLANFYTPFATTAQSKKEIMRNYLNVLNKKLPNHFLEASKDIEKTIRSKLHG